MDYKIKPVEIDETKLNIIKKNWYYHPGLYIGIGAVAAGKSTVLANLLDWWEDHFEDRVILFSPSIGNDPIIQKLIDEEKIFMAFDTFTNEILNSVLDIIKEHEEMDGCKGLKWLICFDDTLGLMPRANSKESKFFNSYISRYRHYPVEGKISLVIFSQYYKDINPIVRCNTSIYMFLGSHSEKNKKVYAEELSSIFNGDESEFNKAWDTAKQDKYDILTLDIRNLKAYKNFDTIIYERDTNNNKPQLDLITDNDSSNASDTE